MDDEPPNGAPSSALPELIADDSALAVSARVSFLLVLIALIVMSFGFIAGSQIFYSHHVAHFAGFYLVTFAAAAALPRRNPVVMWLFILVCAALLEFARWFVLTRTSAGYLDWISDASGSLAALAPLVLQNFRLAFRR